MVGARVVGLFLVVAFLMGILVPSTASGAALIRWPDPGPSSLIGNLTWESGKGKIRWTENAASEDDRPVAPSDYNEQVATASYLADQVGYGSGTASYYTGPATRGLRVSPAGPVDEFVSDPVPRDLYLNVTRGIQVILNLKAHEKNANPCYYFSAVPGGYGSLVQYSYEPHMDVELYAGNILIGGGFGDDYIYWWTVQPNLYQPPHPPGYGTCYYWVHPEMSMLPEGTILTLKVNHLKQLYHYPYGLAGDHRSQIKISLYPADEVLYRYPPPPESDAAEPTGDGATSTSGSFAITGFAMAALAAGASTSPARGRQRIGWALALLFFASVLGGCIVGGPSKAANTAEPLKGNVTNDFVAGGDLTSGATGSILGQVHDDLHVPIGGVHVSAIGAANFTETDSKGRFQLLNLLPGTLRLRFDRKEYISFEAEVAVKAGFVSRPSVMLYLKDPKERDARPHTHDYWSTETKKVVSDVIMDSDCSKATVTTPCSPPQDWRVVPKGDDANTVMPGTNMVDVVLTWDPSKLLVDKVGLIVQTPHDRGMYGNSSVFAPRGPNEPFHITTAWENSDPGHQGYSGWTFRWFVPLSQTRTWDEERIRQANGYDPGDMHAVVTIHRGGELPLEPAHPDHWKGRTSYQLFKDLYGYHSTGSGHPSMTTCKTGYDCYYTYPAVWATYPYSNFPTIVPQGTTWLDVVLKQTRANNPAYGWTLYYKPSNVSPNPSYYSVERFKTVATPYSTDGITTKWKVPVLPEEADFIYAKTTGWQLSILPDNAEADWQDYNVNNNGYVSLVGALTGVGALNGGYKNLQLTVTTHKDPLT